MQVVLNLPGDLGTQTTGSWSRPRCTVAAHAEQPALSDSYESFMERVVAPADLATAWKSVKANRGACGPDGIPIAKLPGWIRPRWQGIRQQLLNVTYRTNDLRSSVRGWMGYLSLASQRKLFDRLDQWIRRRLRKCYWKPWRRLQRRREMRIRLGVPRRQAIRAVIQSRVRQ